MDCNKYRLVRMFPLCRIILDIKDNSRNSSLIYAEELIQTILKQIVD